MESKAGTAGMGGGGVATATAAMLVLLTDGGQTESLVVDPPEERDC